MDQLKDLVPGMEVVARGLRWELTDIQTLGQDYLLRMKGLDRSIAGEELEILHSLEPVKPLNSEINLKKAAPLRNWLIYHQGFILEQALGSDAILTVSPGRLKIEPYQLVPLMRALRMSRPRLLLCDDVGLGKTIQAALILAELMARRLAHRVLIISPAGPLLNQWREELLERFGLKFTVIDREKIEEVRRSSELGANPFDQIQLGLISIDFLKQERFLEQVERSGYDVVIIDEAHHCTDLGELKEADDSLRRRLAEVMANRCDALLLLTATPHNGSDRSFASLLELLDGSLVNGKGEVIADKYKDFVVRRLKRHIKDPVTGEPQFKERNVTPVPVIAAVSTYPDYVAFHKAFLALLAPLLKSAFRTRNYSEVLTFIALLKRSVSSVNACLETLGVVKEKLEKGALERLTAHDQRKERIRTLRDYQRKVEKFGSISYEEELDERDIIAENLAAALVESDQLEKEAARASRAGKKKEDILKAINELIVLAQKAVNSDAKMDAIIAKIKDIRAKEPKANIIVYTEYTDTQKVLVEHLIKENLGGVLSLNGDSKESEKTKMTKDFGKYDDIILVSTDASAEGLNLQARCHNLIHAELPFNPNRLEQRNGRIDRYGQTQIPQIYYVYLKGAFEDRILLRLIAKYERQRAQLSFMPNTLGFTCLTDLSSEKLLKGMLKEEDMLFKEPEHKFDFYNPDDGHTSDNEYKDLLGEIDKSFKLFGKAAKNNIWLGDTGLNADEEHIKGAAASSENGIKLTNIDLLSFVSDAARTEPDAKVAEADGIIQITLPPSWDYDNTLDGFPGYDATTRTILLTGDISVEEDKKGNAVGFLGRSHPLVKIALDRVRNIASIQDTSNYDPRAAAVIGPDSKKHLLFAFTGLIESQKGKAFEKVFAAKISEDGSVESYTAPADWIKLADIDKSINPQDIWDKNFKSWEKSAKEKAISEVSRIFTPISEKFLQLRDAELNQELKKTEEWFKNRVAEVTGNVAEAIQADLFEDKKAHISPDWSKITNPLERITIFAKDKKVRTQKRSEAETLLRLYTHRTKDIAGLKSFTRATIRPIGVLMVLPEGAK